MREVQRRDTVQPSIVDLYAIRAHVLDRIDIRDPLRLILSRVS
ncbi:hypothetical protein [Variovorax sp. WS11]|nr:hypothetical protein [Variovorax sp. WS11]